MLMANVLIIDDDPFIGELLIAIAEAVGHDGEKALTLKEGMALAREERFDVVFLDVILPDGNGLDALPELQLLSNMPEVIIITGQGDSKGAELAINSGAWDYIAKPASQEEYMLHMKRVFQYRTEKQSSSPKLGHHNIVGRSESIVRWDKRPKQRKATWVYCCSGKPARVKSFLPGLSMTTACAEPNHSSLSTVHQFQKISLNQFSSGMSEEHLPALIKVRKV